MPEPAPTGLRAGGPIEPTRVSPFDLDARTAGRLGLGATAAILVGAVVTASAYVGPTGEAYSPFNHFISELGETGQSRLALVFNAGIVIGGLGLGLFLFVLAGHLTARYRPTLMLAALVSGASGTLVGIFPMDTHEAHRLVSGVFFCTGWIVVAIFSAWLARHRAAGLPGWLLVVGAGSIAIFLAFLAVYATYRPADPNAPIMVRSAVWAVPLLEWASLLSLLAWFVCVSAVLLRRRRWPASQA